MGANIAYWTKLLNYLVDKMAKNAEVSDHQISENA